MKIITGLSEQPKQQSTLILADGTRAVWSISYVSQQTGWFYDLSWNGTVIATGQRMVSSPNILRQYINKISFGIAVISPNQLEPTTQTALVDGTITCYLLEGADLQTIETALFNAPPGQVQPVGSTTAGLPVVVLPANWGPAGGDLAYAYPNPQVVAMHEGTGQRLAFGVVEDGKFLKRVGATVIGATVAPGTGNVSGPASSTIGNVTVWADEAGTEVADGGTLGTAAFANSSSFLGATAAATGDLSGNYPDPKVAAIHTGATKLTIGSIANGQYLVRDGDTLIGSTPSGAGDVFGPSSTVTVGTVALFATTDGKTLGPSGITLGTIASQAASNVTITGGSIAGAVITSGVGGSISGVPINGSTIGAVTASTGRFTSVVSTGNISASGTITATGTIGASNFSGTSSGSNTGDQTNISGNAATATALANARTIGGISFNGTDNVTSFPVPGPIGGTTPSTGAFTSVSSTVAGDTITLGASGVGYLQTFNRADANYIRASSAGGYFVFQTSGANNRAVINDSGLAVTGTLSAGGLISANGGSGGFPSLTTAYQLSVGTDIVLGSGYGIIVSGSRLFAFNSTGLAVTGLITATGQYQFNGNRFLDSVSTELRFGDILNSYTTVGLYSQGTAAITLKAGNIGIGVTPSPWGNSANLEIYGNTGILAFRTIATIGANWYYNAGAKYMATGYAEKYEQYNGAHNWYTAASGTAGNAITFTQAMTLDASSNLGVTGSITSNNGTFYGYGYSGDVNKSVIFLRGDLSTYIYNNGAAVYHRVNGTDALTLTNSGATVYGTFTASGFGVNNTPTNQGTSPTYGRWLNTSGDFYVGCEGSASGGFFTGSSAYASILYSPQPIQAIISGVKKVEINSTGLAVTGAGSFTGNLSVVKNGAYLILDGVNSDAEIQWKANTAERWALGMNVGDSTENWNLYNYTTGSVNLSVSKTTGSVSIPALGTGFVYSSGGALTSINTIAIGNGGTGLSTLGTAGQVLRVNAGATALEYATISSGSGTVTSVSVVNANGFDGTVATPTVAAAITLKTTVNGILKGNSTSGVVSAATSGTDYAPATSGSSILYGNGAGGFSNVTVGTGLTFTSGTLAATGGGSGTVTTVSVVAANGVTGSVANPTTTPAITLTLGDISAATSKPSGTGAVARSFQSRDGDVFNVKDFGATGDGSTDDTAAIAAAFALACSTSKSGTLYFPSGTYLNNNTLTGSFGVHDQMYGFTIMGDGIGTTIIKQTVNPTSGTYKGVFDITNVSCLGCLTIKDLSFWNISGMSTDACIKYAVSEIREDDAHANLRVDNLFIGANFGANSWTIGLDLYRVHNGNIYNYQYCGDNNRGGTGIVFQKYGSGATSGASKSMACFIQGCQFNLCNIGVRLKDSMETCLIQECLMVGLVYGVYADYCIHLGVSNSHINVNPSVGTGVACIYSSGTGGDVDQSVIMGNLLYCQGGIDLIGISGGFVRSSFSGNSFIALGGQAGTKGISISGKGLSITGNSFYQHTDTYITSSAEYSIISSNTATKDPGPVATTPYSITGTGTTSANNIYQP